jgi:hypothetical protein
VHSSHEHCNSFSLKRVSQCWLFSVKITRQSLPIFIILYEFRHGYISIRVIIVDAISDYTETIEFLIVISRQLGYMQQGKSKVVPVL